MRVTACFSYPYRLGKGIAADFECRASAEVQRDRRRVLYPSQPPAADVIEGFSDIEVEVFERPEAAAGFGTAWARAWAKPDAHLEALIRAHLESGAEDDLFVEAWEEAA